MTTRHQRGERSRQRTPSERARLVEGAAMRPERGTVTAETALVLPLVAAFVMTLVWMVTVVIAQVQTVDAARDAARALARGEDHDAVLQHAQMTAPEGAQVEVSGTEGRVTVDVSVEADAPGWLLVPLPSVSVGAHSTVEVEADVDAE